MRRNVLYAVVILTGMWLILVESFSWFSIGTGAIISTICVVLCRKLMPLEPVNQVKFSRLLFYPFYLIGQIYIQGFLVIKMILSGVRVDIVEVKTGLQSEFLQAILINFITLTPGSVPLGIEGETLTVLNLGSAKDEEAYRVVETQRARVEKILIQAQR